MSKNSTASYYRDDKARLKKVCRRYQSFSKEEKEKK